MTQSAGAASLFRLMQVLDRTCRSPQALGAPPDEAAGNAAEADAFSALLRAACEGHRDAARVVVTKLLPRVRNLVRYLVRGDQDVDDIAQEALIALIRGLPQYRGEGAFEAWTDRVVVRVTFAHLRRRRAQPALAALSSDDLRGAQPGMPTDEYLLRRRATALLDELPEDQRQALVLHHVLEMSVPEVAEHLGAPLETVRSRLRLAKTRLRERAALAAADWQDVEPEGGAA